MMTVLLSLSLNLVKWNPKPNLHICTPIGYFYSAMPIKHIVTLFPSCYFPANAYVCLTFGLPQHNIFCFSAGVKIYCVTSRYHF